MNYVANLARSEGDPKILSTGPSSLASSDRLGRALGWFSLALGAIELLAPRRFTRALGMQGREGLVRAYGVRELGAGIMSLSPDKQLGLWSRVAGDGLDLLTLAAASRPKNSRRKNVSLAICLVVGVTLLDVVAAQMTTSRHRRPRGWWRDYGDRSGFPRGVEDARRRRAAG
jgi:hypothetical protein